MNALTVFLKNNGLNYLFMGDMLSLYQTSKKVQKLLWMNAKQVWSSVLNSGEKQFRYWFKHVFYLKAAAFAPIELKDIIEYQMQFTKNLFRNPNGKHKFEYWRISKNGGDGWAVTTCYPHLKLKQIYKKPQYAFVGSYSECEMTQVLDLSSFKNVFKSMDFRCQFQAGVYVARDPEVPCTTTKVQFSIIGTNDCYLYEEGTEIAEELTGEYRLVLFNIRNNPNLVKNAKHIALTLSTKSAENAKGWHAARFTDALFRIIPEC